MRTVCFSNLFLVLSALLIEQTLASDTQTRPSSVEPEMFGQTETELTTATTHPFVMSDNGRATFPRAMPVSAFMDDRRKTLTRMADANGQVRASVDDLLKLLMDETPKVPPLNLDPLDPANWDQTANDLKNSGALSSRRSSSGLRVSGRVRIAASGKTADSRLSDLDATKRTMQNSLSDGANSHGANGDGNTANALTLCQQSPGLSDTNARTPQPLVGSRSVTGSTSLGDGHGMHRCFSCGALNNNPGHSPFDGDSDAASILSPNSPNANNNADNGGDAFKDTTVQNGDGDNGAVDNNKVDINAVDNNPVNGGAVNHNGADNNNAVDSNSVGNNKVDGNTVDGNTVDNNKVDNASPNARVSTAVTSPVSTVQTDDSLKGKDKDCGTVLPIGIGDTAPKLPLDDTSITKPASTPAPKKNPSTDPTPDSSNEKSFTEVYIFCGVISVIILVVAYHCYRIQHLSADNEDNDGKSASLTNSELAANGSPRNGQRRTGGNRLRFDGKGTAKDHAMKPKGLRKRYSSSSRTFSSTLAVVAEGNEPLRESDGDENDNDDNDYNEEEIIDMRTESSVIAMGEFDTREADAERYRRELVAKIQSKEEPWHKFLSSDPSLADYRPPDSCLIEMSSLRCPTSAATVHSGEIARHRHASIGGGEYHSDPEIAESPEKAGNRSQKKPNIMHLAEFQPEITDFISSIKVDNIESLTKNERYLIQRGFSF